MNKLWLSCASAAIFCLTTIDARAACRDDDLPCFRRGFLERGREIESLAKELGLKDQLLKGKDEQIQLQTGLIESQKGALDTARSALPAAQRAWHESPTLWFGVGFGAAALLAVGLAFALGAASR